MKAPCILLNGVLALLLCALLAFGLPRFFGVQYFSVISGSMTPEIPVGSLVVSVPTESNNIHPGDVISYVANEDLDVITHRVVSFDAQTNSFITQGDANDAPDSPVLAANVVGVSKFTVPHLGYALSYLSTTSGKVVGITAIAAVVLLAFMVETLRRKKSSNKKLVIYYDQPSDITDEVLRNVREDVVTGTRYGVIRREEI